MLDKAAAKGGLVQRLACTIGDIFTLSFELVLSIKTLISICKSVH